MNKKLFSALLSLSTPGLGQLYLGGPLKAVIEFLAFAVSLWFVKTGVIPVVIALSSSLNAFLLAQRKETAVLAPLRDRIYTVAAGIGGLVWFSVVVSYWLPVASSLAMDEKIQYLTNHFNRCHDTKIEYENCVSQIPAEKMTDFWGQPFQLIKKNGLPSVISNGPDQKGNTRDDIEFKMPVRF